MTKEALQKIWTVIGLACCYASINAYLQTQGSEIFLAGLDFEKTDRAAATVYGLFICIPLLYLTIRVAKAHQKICPSNRWHELIPISFGLKLDTKEKNARLYQKFFIFAFIIIPALCLVHLIREFFDGRIWIRNKEAKSGYEEILHGWREHLSKPEPFLDSWGNLYRYGDNPQNGVTIFPFYESWFLLFITIAILIYAIHFLVKIFANAKVG